MKFLLHLGLLIFYPLLTHQWTPPGEPYYIGGVVQYTPADVEVHEKNATYVNANNYVKIIKQAAKSLVDIVVFPEGSLTIPASDNPKDLYDLATYLPEPREGVILCVNKTGRYSDYLKILSCAAIDHQVYVVLNLLEKKDCCHKDKECPANKFHVFETNLVLDRSGRVVAKYRWYDRNTKEVPKIVPTTFVADFGVNLGLLADRDVLQRSPALNLTRDLKVRDILLSTNLIAELPFAAGIASQAAYAHAYDVNLLAAGKYAPGQTNGDSGIYFGRDGIVQAVAANRESNVLITTKVPKFKKDGSRHIGINQAYTHVYEFKDIPTSKNKPGNFSYETIDIRQYPGHALDLNETSARKNICDGDFCCDFEVEYTFAKEILSPDSQYYRYRLVAYNGPFNLSEVKLEKTKLCAVVACADDSVHSCGRLLNSTEFRYKEAVKFESIEIKISAGKPIESSVFVPTGAYANLKLLNATQDYTFELDEGGYSLKYEKPAWFKRGSLLNFALASYDYESNDK